MKMSMKKLVNRIAVGATACTLLAGMYVPMQAEAAETSNEVKYFSNAPTIDGKVKDDEWGEVLFVVEEGEANINILKEEEDDVLEPFTADVYVGYDSTHIYIAAVAEYENHLNETIKTGDLWRGDCMQIQISAISGAKRNEFNFSNNSVSGKSMVDAPFCTGNFSMQGGEGKDFIVVREGDKTTYEMAISVDQFTKDVTELTEGMTLPFSVSFHQNGGAFLEYCGGIVEDKDITLAGNIVLGEGAKSTGKDNTSDSKGEDNSEDNEKSAESNKMTLIYIVIGVAVVLIAVIVVIFVMGNRKSDNKKIEDSDDNEK